MISSVTDFTGALYLPNINEVATTSYKTDFLAFLEAKENEWLKIMFGYDLGKKIADAYAAYIAVPSVPLDARYAAIINGVEFTDSFGNLNKWEGLKSANSPILPYVYWTWLMTKVTNTTISGEMLNEVENSVSVGYTDKIASNYNAAVDSNQILLNYLKTHSATYPEFNAYFDWFTAKRRGLLTKINSFGI